MKARGRRTAGRCRSACVTRAEGTHWGAAGHGAGAVGAERLHRAPRCGRHDSSGSTPQKGAVVALTESGLGKAGTAEARSSFCPHAGLRETGTEPASPGNGDGGNAQSDSVASWTGSMRAAATQTPQDSGPGQGRRCPLGATRGSGQVSAQVEESGRPRPQHLEHGAECLPPGQTQCSR